MRVGKCTECGREAWVNVATLREAFLGEFCAGCWRWLELPEETGLPAIRRVKTASEEPNPWGEVAVRALEDAPADLEVRDAH